mmetsp:Transcript_29512/g.88210  ORF Transcript_29512/g.88210 Transcript_29512/m.88210 type:complete len:81 (-) Transcript_29512:95-337(-)
MKGGTKTLRTATVVMLEVPFFGVYNKGAPGFAAYIAFMHRQGFIPLNLVHGPQIPLKKGGPGYRLYNNIFFVKASFVYQS